jgi:cell division protein ZapA
LIEARRRAQAARGRSWRGCAGSRIARRRVEGAIGEIDRLLAEPNGGALMASIEIEIAGRKYSVACRDGEEEHLRSVGALVDKRARDAAQALGSLGEARLLLFTSLLLADDLKERRKSAGRANRQPNPTAIAEALEALADRIENSAKA